MDLSSLVLSKLADASVRALCLAVLALSALRLGRVRFVSVQHAVSTVTLGAMLLLPFVSPFLPAIPLPVRLEIAADVQPSPAAVTGSYSTEPVAARDDASDFAFPSWHPRSVDKGGRRVVGQELDAAEGR